MTRYDQYRQMKGIAELNSQAWCAVESFNIVSAHLDLKLTWYKALMFLFMLQNSEEPRARRNAMHKQGQEIWEMQRKQSKKTGREKGKININFVVAFIYVGSTSS